ncbi:hypothetical protein TB2_017444 [Malus domestica]
MQIVVAVEALVMQIVVAVEALVMHTVVLGEELVMHIVVLGEAPLVNMVMIGGVSMLTREHQGWTCALNPMGIKAGHLVGELARKETASTENTSKKLK